MPYKNTFIFDHPLIQHKISLLRDKNTGTKDFRELTEEVSMLMVYEVTRNLLLTEIEIETPISKAKTNVLAAKPVTLVPILRAGLGMVAGIQKLIPNAKVGHIGIYRDHTTLQPVEYYCKMPPNIKDSIVFILDPMFATGGSATAAVEYLKSMGACDLRLVCIIAAEYALEMMNKEHPDIPIFCAAVDAKLNSDKYIVPGLGDAGDRIFGTK